MVAGCLLKWQKRKMISDRARVSYRPRARRLTAIGSTGICPGLTTEATYGYRTAIFLCLLIIQIVNVEAV
jgi:hypothetical protein